MEIINLFIKVPRYTAVFIISTYQFLFSTDHAFWAKPEIFRLCTYQPSCSEFTKQSILKHGLILGAIIGLKRIIDCNPFSHGGFDPVPEKFTLKRYQGKNAKPAF